LVLAFGFYAAAAFRQVQPGDNLEPSQHTEVLIGYDRRALYLAFRAEDTSGNVRASVARRDAISDDDIIGVYLDTFPDRRRAYYAQALVSRACASLLSRSMITAGLPIAD
jgi:hypothetical protein